MAKERAEFGLEIITTEEGYNAKIMINGKEITTSTSALTLQLAVGMPPRVVLDLIPQVDLDILIKECNITIRHPHVPTLADDGTVN